MKVMCLRARKTCSCWVELPNGNLFAIKPDSCYPTMVWGYFQLVNRGDKWEIDRFIAGDDCLEV